MNEISVFYEHIRQAAVQTGRGQADIMMQIKAAGLSALEIDGTLFASQPFFVRWLLQKTGFKVSCIYQTYDWGNHPDGSQAKRQVDLANQYGARVILIVPGFLPEEEAKELNGLEDAQAVTDFMDSNVHTRNMAAALRNIVAYAKIKGVKVTLEDYDGSTAPYARKNQLLWFMKNVPGLFYTFDTGNFIFSDEDAREGYEALKNYIAHVHCKDRGEEPENPHGKINRGLKPVAVGEGYLPIKEMLSELVKMDYQGYFAVEHFDAPDQVDCMCRSGAAMKEILTSLS